jgi:hypothetical protein
MAKFDFNVKNFKGDNWLDEGKGSAVEKLNELTARDLISKAGLDYPVTLEPTYRKNSAGEFVVTGEYGTVNTHSDKFIRGGFGEDYTPKSFGDVFESTIGDVYDSLCDDGFIPSNVVSLDEGDGMIFQMRLPKTVTIKDRAHMPYLNMTMGHNGKHGIKPSGGDTCAVCANTCAIVLSESALMKIIKHTKNLDSNLAMLASNISAVLVGMNEHYTKLESFASVKIDRADVNKFLKVLLPDTFLRDNLTANKARGNQRVSLGNDIDTTIKESNSSEVTIYDLLAGVTRYNTHTSNLNSKGEVKRDEASQFVYTLTTGMKLYTEAEELAVKMFA